MTVYRSAVEVRLMVVVRELYLSYTVIYVESKKIKLLRSDDLEREYRKRDL